MAGRLRVAEAPRLSEAAALAAGARIEHAPAPAPVAGEPREVVAAVTAHREGGAMVRASADLPVVERGARRLDLVAAEGEARQRVVAHAAGQDVAPDQRGKPLGIERQREPAALAGGVLELA